MSDIFTKQLEVIKSSPVKPVEMSSPETDTNSQQSQDGIRKIFLQFFVLLTVNHVST